MDNLNSSRRLRFAVGVNPGVGLMFLRAIQQYNLTPAHVITHNPYLPDRPGGLATTVRGHLRRAALAGSEALGLDWVAQRSNTWAFARQQGWPTSATQTVHEPRDIDHLASLDLDYLLLFSFPLLRRSVFTVPELGTLSFHPSLLPAHRGPTPVFWTLDSGDAEAGFCVIAIDEGIDTGRVMFRQPVAVVPEEGADVLMHRLCAMGARAFARLILGAEHGVPIEPLDSGEARTPYERRPSPEQMKINGEMTAKAVTRRVRASLDRGGARLEDATGQLLIRDVISLGGSHMPPETFDALGVARAPRGHRYLKTRDGELLLLVPWHIDADASDPR